MRNLALIALLSVAPSMSAQKMISPAFAAPRATAYSSGGTLYSLETAGMRPRSFLYPVRLFSDSFYSDALYSTGYPVAAEPPVIILQNPPAAASILDRPPAPAQPLTIELRGDRYVRITGQDTSGAQMQMID